MIDTGTDASITSIDAARGYGQKPDQIGKQDRKQRSAEQEPGGHAECSLHGTIDGIVDEAKRQEHADSHHRAGDRIAQAGKPHTGPRDRRAADPEAIGQQGSSCHDDHGRQGCQHERVASIPQEPGTKEWIPAFHMKPDEDPHRDDEAKKHRKAAHQPGQPPVPAH